MDTRPTPQSNRWLIPVLKLVAYIPSVFVAEGVLGGLILFITYMLIPIAGVDVGLGMPGRFSLFAITVSYVVVAAVAFLVTVIFVQYLDHRSTESLGIVPAAGWGREFLFGAGLGLVLIAIIFVINYIAKWSLVTGTLFSESPLTVIGTLLMTIILMICIAIAEEVVFRGYILQTLTDGFGVLPALIVSSVIFGIVHLTNPGGTLMGVLGVTAAGVVLAYGYFATGRLFLPMGFHFAWNFAEGPIFGFPVSGISIKGWIQQIVSGPAVWTGGAFGPEAGLLSLVVLILGVLAIRLFTAGKNV